MHVNLKEKIKLNFNRSFKTYDQYCSVQNNVCQNAIDLLLKHANRFDMVCDFACGTGESTQQLIDRVNYNNCYAIDFSENLLNIARQKLPENIKLILSDFDDPIFNNEYLDLAFCNMGLQWSSDLTTTLSGFNESLKKNGLLVFSMPINNNFPEIKDDFKFKMLNHEDIKNALEISHFELLEYSCQHFPKIFSTPIDILRSIKSIGANCINSTITGSKKGLSKSYNKEIFVNPEVSTLTYTIGIYLAIKR